MVQPPASTNLETEFSRLLQINKQQALLIEKLTFELAHLKRMMFGRKSEATADIQADLFGGVETVELPVLQRKPVTPESKPKPPAHARRLPIPSNLRREDRLLDLPDDRKFVNGVPLKRIGEEISEQLQREPGNWWVLRTTRPKYAVPGDPDAGIRIMPPIPTVIDGGLLGESALAHIAVSKFCDHLPLNRQIEIAQRDGLALALSTISDNLLSVAEIWLKPLIRAMWVELRTATALHIDETVLATLAKGQTSKTRIWTCLGRVNDVGPSVILYHYTQNKAGQHVRDLLKDWPGERKVYLQADAASNYDELYRQFPKIHEVGCWAHARRKFHEIAKSADKPIFAHEAVDFINQLFEIDRTFRENQDPDRLAQRQAAATAVLNKLKGACETKLKSLAPKTPTAHAIRYVIKHWKALSRYLEQPHLRPDNNAAERALRKAAIGRKNWLFAGSERGGEAAAIYYSLLETAKANGLNPWQWLTKTLTVLPTLNGSTYVDLKDLLPLRPPPAPA